MNIPLSLLSIGDNRSWAASLLPAGHVFGSASTFVENVLASETSSLFTVRCNNSFRALIVDSWLSTVAPSVLCAPDGPAVGGTSTDTSSMSISSSSQKKLSSSETDASEIRLDNWWLYDETGLDNMLIRFCVSVLDMAGADEATVCEQDGTGAPVEVATIKVGECVGSLPLQVDVAVAELGVAGEMVVLVFVLDGIGRRSMPGTSAAGTGGGAGSGEVGSRVGNSGARISGSLLYKFSRGEKIFISRNFWRNVSTHSCIISLANKTYKYC